MKHNFIIVDTDLMMRDDISANEAIMFSILFQYKNEGQKKTKIKVKTLMKYFNKSEAFVNKIIDSLNSKGFFLDTSMVTSKDKSEDSFWIIQWENNGLSEGKSLVTFMSDLSQQIKLYSRGESSETEETLYYNISDSERINFYSSMKPLKGFHSVIKINKKDSNRVFPRKKVKPIFEQEKLGESNYGRKPKEVKVSKHVVWMINYWNNMSAKHDNLPKKVNKTHGGNTTKVYIETVKACNQFLNGKLFTTKGIGIAPKRFTDRDEHIKKYSYSEFETYVDRFMKVLLDKQIKPVDKSFVQSNCTLKNFISGSIFGKFPSMFLDYCFTEPQVEYKLQNNDYLSCIEKAWTNISSTYESSAANQIMLDKALTHILKVLKRVKIDPKSYKITITETLPKFVKSQWNGTKPRVSYLSSNSFYESYLEFMKENYHNFKN